MERKSIIAIVGTVAGVMVAGSVASVAVINAASAGTPTSDTVALTAAQQSQSPLFLPEAPAAPSSIEVPVIETPVTPAQADAAPGSEAPSAAPAVLDIGMKAARNSVMNSTGGTLVSSTRETRDGFDAYAVQVTRPDGSVVTGYVDSASGVIFSWVVNKEAPAAVVNYEDDEYEDDEYENDEYENDEDSDHDEEDERDNDDD